MTETDSVAEALCVVGNTKQYVACMCVCVEPVHISDETSNKVSAIRVEL